MQRPNNGRQTELPGINPAVPAAEDSLLPGIPHTLRA